ALEARMQTIGKKPPKTLSDWRIRTVFESLGRELDTRKKDMSTKLAESFESHWPALAHQLRTSRNDAGHPTSLDPVSSETVHADLLLFPGLASLATELIKWIGTGYN